MTPLKDINSQRTDMQEPLFPAGTAVPSTDGSEARVERYEHDPEEGVLVRLVAGFGGGEHETAFPVSARTVAAENDLGALFDRLWLRSKARPLFTVRQGTVRIVDLFSGCGGMTLGVWEACRALGIGLTPLLAVDDDATALEVYDENLQPEYAKHGRIENLLNGELGDAPTPTERTLMDRLGRVNFLVAGPPCQGHSDLNNLTRRNDPKNQLFLKVARFAELFEPDHIIIENVEGILHDTTDVFHRTCRYLEHDLEELDYNVDGGKIRAETVGVAQYRHRVFLVASRRIGVSISRMIRPFVVDPRDFGWACEDLEDVAGTDGGFDAASNPAAVTKERIEYLFRHGLHELPDSERPPCHRHEKHTYPSVYGRMWYDRPAPTITTGFTVMGQGRFVHPTRKRTITPHEAARLQFFPDFMSFGHRTRTAYKKLIGNAVPPKLTYILALQLLR